MRDHEDEFRIDLQVRAGRDGIAIGTTHVLLDFHGEATVKKLNVDPSLPADVVADAMETLAVCVLRRDHGNDITLSSLRDE